MKNKSIIMQMYDGERGSLATIPIQRSKKYMEWAAKEDEIYTALREKLLPEHFEMVEKMISVASDISVNEAGNFYEEGFRLGALLMIDILCNEKI